MEKCNELQLTLRDCNEHFVINTVALAIIDLWYFMMHVMYVHVQTVIKSTQSKLLEHIRELQFRLHALKIGSYRMVISLLKM